MTDKELKETVSKLETYQHKHNVQYGLKLVIEDLLERQWEHDDSKIYNPVELSMFSEFGSRLKGSTYGSEEYKKNLKEMGVALREHYETNSHHPEHHSKPGESPTLENMNLMEIMEMLVDWWAGTKRHSNGHIDESIEINQERFGYDDTMKQILKNTLKDLNLG